MIEKKTRVPRKKAAPLIAAENVDRVRSGSAYAGPLNQEPPVLTNLDEPKRDWKYLPWALLAACVLVLAIVLFKKKDEPKPTADQTGELRAWKEAAYAWRDQAHNDSTEKEEYKKLAFEALNKVSQNKTYYIESKKKYDAIPDAIRALNREQLRREITDIVVPRPQP